MRLAPSELILREDHSVYHLALRPEHLAPTVIVVGDPGRVPMVSRHFDHLEYKKSNREFITHTGTLGKRRLTVLSTGIGTGNIDIVLNELDALVNIDLTTRIPKEDPMALDLIRVGTSGGLQPDVPIDSFVLTDLGMGFDGLLHFYESESVRLTGIEAEFRSFASWSELLPKPYVVASSDGLCEQLASERTLPGFTVTQGGFYAPQGRRLRLPTRVPEFLDTLAAFRSGTRVITNMEMETSALFGLSALLGHRAASLNVILANRPNGTFSKNPRAAMEGLIAYTLEKLIETPSQ